MIPDHRQSLIAHVKPRMNHVGFPCFDWQARQIVELCLYFSSRIAGGQHNGAKRAHRNILGLLAVVLITRESNSVRRDGVVYVAVDGATGLAPIENFLGG
jgi:hypothetical protein